MACGSVDGTARLLRVEDGAEIRTLAGHVGTVFGVAFRQDGAMIATSSADKLVRLWGVIAEPAGPAVRAPVK